MNLLDIVSKLEIDPMRNISDWLALMKVTGKTCSVLLREAYDTKKSF